MLQLRSRIGMGMWGQQPLGTAWWHRVARGGTGWQGPAAAGAVVAPGAAQVARLKRSRRVVAVFCVLILSCPHVPPCYPLLPL